MEIEYQPFTKYLEEYNEHSLAKLDPEDADLIREFIIERRATKHIKDSRVRGVISKLVVLRSFFGPYQQNTYKDLLAGITKVKLSKYKDGTKRESITILKMFYRWLILRNYTGITKDEIDQIKRPSESTSIIDPHSVLTKDEIKQIIERGCLNSRDRALVALLYETGARVSEAGALRWTHLQFDKKGVRLTVPAVKTKERYIRLVYSKEYLLSWKNDYPTAIDGQQYVFVNKRYRTLHYGSLRTHLARVVQRAGIKKKFTIHLLRHSRATHLVQEGYNESIIKLMLWGDINTRQLRRYAHPGEQDIDREIFRKNRMEDAEEILEDPLAPRLCTGCGHINGVGSQYCTECGFPLTESARQTYQDKVAKIKKSREFEEIDERLKRLEREYEL